MYFFYQINNYRKNIIITPSNIQPDQINMAVLFWYLVKRDAIVRYYAAQYSNVQWTVDKSSFTRYKKHTAMYNLSPCTWTRNIENNPF